MSGKEVITEDDVRGMAPGETLVLGLGRIATPSALDLACERGIRVRHDGDAHPTPAPAPRLHGGGRLDSLSDGKYLVEVKGGRLEIWRLGENGPELVRQ